jgi:hypothetical protein
MPVPNTNVYELVGENVLRIRTKCGDCFLIDAEDEALARQHCWSTHAHGYARAVRRVGAKLKNCLSASIALQIYRSTESRSHVDHISGDVKDCRKVNLRPCTRSENLRNQKRRADNTSGFKGVGIHSQSGMFRARIRVAGREKHLGLFQSASAAAAVAIAARESLHQEFARHA